VVLVELQVRAPGHAERVRLVGEPPRIEQAEILSDDVLERDEPNAVPQRHEARQRVRHLQVSEVHRAGAGVAHHDRQREPQVGDQREGVTGRAGHRLRGDDRKDLLREVAPERLPLRLGQPCPADDPDALRGECGQARPDAATLALEERADPDRDDVELLLR
jgi:hypothetical protein